jgi:uncharacterized phage infection (PIP) family protein YhgE
MTRKDKHRVLDNGKEGKTSEERWGVFDELKKSAQQAIETVEKQKKVKSEIISLLQDQKEEIKTMEERQKNNFDDKVKEFDERLERLEGAMVQGMEEFTQGMKEFQKARQDMEKMSTSHLFDPTGKRSQ